MNDVMVTGRMSRAKKDAGSRVLEELGINASQLINDLYDYLIEHGHSPFQTPTDSPKTVSKEQLTSALTHIDSLCLPAKNRFREMTDNQIRQERLSKRGLVEA
ncbi:MAG: RelB/DinJ family addiction module antitoxin [Eggerthellaceae bacterium]|nr:RelB/DinJ family addiction module antitoxin [Eggerthellaceae bacterium]